MKYFIDTEFIEGTQEIYYGPVKAKTMARIFQVAHILMSLFILYTQGWILGIIVLLFGYLLAVKDEDLKSSNTIDLISIGIVAEDGRALYHISKDFNMRDAWNRYDLKINKQYPTGPKYVKAYWIKENVLRPIFNELILKEKREVSKARRLGISIKSNPKFTYKNFKRLINKYGSTNQEIAEEIKEFCEETYYTVVNDEDSVLKYLIKDKHVIYDIASMGTTARTLDKKISFYGYFADYDWVVFCWLFGKMIDLPKGFPMYCNDIKQISEEAWRFRSDYKNFLDHPDCPVNIGEHNALEDARWHFKLYKFISTI